MQIVLHTIDIPYDKNFKKAMRRFIKARRVVVLEKALAVGCLWLCWQILKTQHEEIEELREKAKKGD